MNAVLRNTLLFSLLVHGLLYWVFMSNIQLTVAPSKANSTTVEFELAPMLNNAEPVPSQLDNEQHASRHMEDDLTKANNSQGTAEQKSAQRPSEGQQQAKDSSKVQASEPLSKQTEEPVIHQPVVQSQQSNHSINPYAVSLADYLKAQQKKGKPKETSNDALDASFVESPLEPSEEEKARWYNEILKRITEQIHYMWVKPAGISVQFSGVIRLDISAQGYLQDAWIHLPSGSNTLDQSALRAIRSVMRYDIPHSEKLSRQYRHLEFHYRGDG